MLPEQVLANSGVLSYFDSAHFLCLACPPDVLRSRLAGRVGSGAAAAGQLPARIEVWLDFNGALVAAASEIPTATVVDAGRTIDQVEHDVRNWLNAQLHPRGALWTDSAASSEQQVRSGGR